jgi:hypothetical protein
MTLTVVIINPNPVFDMLFIQHSAQPIKHIQLRYVKYLIAITGV